MRLKEEAGLPECATRLFVSPQTPLCKEKAGAFCFRHGGYPGSGGRYQRNRKTIGLQKSNLSG